MEGSTLHVGEERYKSVSLCIMRGEGDYNSVCRRDEGVAVCSGDR